MFALMDLRKLQVFGFAMALLDMSGCLGYLLGPLFASFFGDSWKCLGVAPAVAVLCVAVLPSFAHEVEDHRVELAKKRQGEQASIGKEIEQVRGYDTAGVLGLQCLLEHAASNRHAGRSCFRQLEWK